MKGLSVSVSIGLSIGTLLSLLSLFSNYFQMHVAALSCLIVELFVRILQYNVTASQNIWKVISRIISYSNHKLSR